MIHRGVGTIKVVHTEPMSSIVTLVLSVRGEARTVHGQSRQTGEALCAMFPDATTLIGKRVRYRREGPLLLEIGPVV